MREFLILCLVLLVAVSSVRTSVMYRKYREIDIPVEEIRIQDSAQEVVGELRKVVPVEVDIVEPVVVLKEEVIVPVEIEKKLENRDPEEVSLSLNEISGKTRADEIPSENDLEEKVNEQKTEMEESQEPGEAESSMNANGDENVLHDLRQSGNTTVRPTLLQQIINNNPIGQFIDSIRRPLTSTVAPTNNAAETSTNPNLFQQLQASAQNLGSQIVNAFIPNQNNEASTPRPPTILENLQTNFQNVAGSVFRPPSTDPAANPTPVGPIQGIFSSVQSFFTGNRGTEPTQTDTASISTDSNKPVDDKVQAMRNSEEVRESSENSEQEIVVGEDSSE